MKGEKVMHIEIMEREAFQARTLAIVRGENVVTPETPKQYFESIRSVAEIFCKGNIDILRAIQEHKPLSLLELSELTGRKTSSLSRTLKTMEALGIVTILKEGKQIRPIVNVTKFVVEFSL